MNGRAYIARHGETVFNAASRMQGEAPHTPLTRLGFAQADGMGALLRAHLGPRPKLDLWSSPSGRALQTLAVIAEHLELDWHRTRIDDRLREIDIGDWGGRYIMTSLPRPGRSSIPPPACSAGARPAANIMTMSRCACRHGWTTRKTRLRTA